MNSALRSAAKHKVSHHKRGRSALTLFSTQTEELHTNEQVVCDVQPSWKVVAGIAPQAASLFYANLFEANPELKPLFKGNMDDQGKKLMQMIGAAVGKLNALDSPLISNVRHHRRRRHAGMTATGTL